MECSSRICLHLLILIAYCWAYRVPLSGRNGGAFPRSDANALTATRSIGIDLGTTYSLISVIENGRPIILPVDGHRLLPSVASYTPEGNVIVGTAALERQVADPLHTYSSVKRLAGRTLKEATKTGDQILFKKQLTSFYDETRKADMCALSCKYPVHTPNTTGYLKPAEILSQIVKRLIERGNEYYGGDDIVKNAVITVPAYFDFTQLRCIEQAGYLAGLEKVRMLKEPEAAALAYGLNTKETQLVMVFDLGGGTLDISILEIGNGLIEVIATTGDAHLGGDDFDACVLDWIYKQLIDYFPQEFLDQMKGSPVIKSHLLQKAKEIKITLSTSAEVNVTIAQETWRLCFQQKIFSKDYYLSTKETVISHRLTRSQFERLVSPLLARILPPLREASYMAGVNLPGDSGQISNIKWDDDEEGVSNDFGEEGDDTDDIEDISLRSLKDMENVQKQGRNDAKRRQKVKGRSTSELKKVQKVHGNNVQLPPGGLGLDQALLIGGATRMPCILKLIRTLTHIDPKRHIHPDEAVGLGAGVQAGILDGRVEDVQILTSFQAEIVRAMYEMGMKKEELFIPMKNNGGEEKKKKEQEGYEIKKALGIEKNITPVGNKEPIVTGKDVSEVVGERKGSSNKTSLYKRLKKLKQQG